MQSLQPMHDVIESPPDQAVPEYVLSLERAASYLPPDQLQRLRRAWAVGAAAHAGQSRKSGEPYITHPVAVAKVLRDFARRRWRYPHPVPLPSRGRAIASAAFQNPPPP